jgi:glycosyltransferase involved in cell wall biosynthesis
MEPLSEAYDISLSPIFSRDIEARKVDRKIIKMLPFGKRTAQSQWVFPRSVSRLNHDLVHFFAHGDASAWGGLNQVVTVLDLIPLKFPELYRARKSNLRFSFARYLEFEAVRRAKGIIVISEATKRDVVNLLGVDPNKIVVTHLAADSRFTTIDPSSEELTQISLKYQLPQDRPMLLYVGGIDPRKNVEFLIDIYAEVMKSGNLKTPPYLVLAGNIEGDDQYPSLCAKIESLGLGAEVMQLGFVPDKDLPRLYQKADLSIFPSLYEGFGLPVLESMACSTPVIAGRNSSIPEVVGGAFDLFEDACTQQWVQAIVTYLEDSSLLKEVSTRSVEQAKNFNWESTARRTLEAYEQFGGRKLQQTEGSRKHAQQDPR